MRDTYRLAVRMRHRWAAGELGYWLWTAGEPTGPADWTARPYAAQIAGDWAAAAAQWRELGCPYEAALALATGEDAELQVAALEELRCMGAWPAVDQLARRLREHGVRRLPRRPRGAARDNPAQLTARELEVLEQLTAGLRNADIGARLHISPKTVDHHVSAILAKIGVGTRQEAARWARRISGDPPEDR